MLFTYVLVFILTFKAFVCSTTTITSSPTTTSSPSATHVPVPVFIALTRPLCVLQNADPRFTFQVEQMLLDLRGDNVLPPQFRQIVHGDGRSIWVVNADRCELRLTPRLSQSQLIGLPRSVIERLWALGLKEAIRNIYFECVKNGHVGGAQVWSWRGTANEPVVDVEVAILRMHQRRDGSCFPRSRSCVIS